LRKEIKNEIQYERRIWNKDEEKERTVEYTVSAGFLEGGDVFYSEMGIPPNILYGRFVPWSCFFFDQIIGIKMWYFC
jgi:hypothetical protein